MSSMTIEERYGWQIAVFVKIGIPRPEVIRLVTNLHNAEVLRLAGGDG